MRRITACLALFASAAAHAAGAAATIQVDASQQGPKLNPRMYGIFLEEINHGVDGGLYAELVANRAFEDSRPPEGFTLKNGRYKDEKGYDSGFDVKPGTVPRWTFIRDGGAKGAMHLETSGGLNENIVEVLAYGCLTPAHATQFKAFYKQVHSDYRLTAILKGDQRWPDKPGDRDILYFLSQALRAHLIKELPRDHKKISRAQNDLLFRAKALIGQLASINLEIAQMVVSEEEGQEQGLPDWFLVEVVRDLPRLVRMKENDNGAQTP